MFYFKLFIKQNKRKDFDFWYKKVDPRVVWIDIMIAYWTYSALPDSFSTLQTYGQPKLHLLSQQVVFW